MLDLLSGREQKQHNLSSGSMQIGSVPSNPI
jgi:hypothetical protein